MRGHILKLIVLWTVALPCLAPADDWDPGFLELRSEIWTNTYFHSVDGLRTYARDPKYQKEIVSILSHPQAKVTDTIRLQLISKLAVDNPERFGRLLQQFFNQYLLEANKGKHSREDLSGTGELFKNLEAPKLTWINFTLGDIAGSEHMSQTLRMAAIGTLGKRIQLMEGDRQKIWGEELRKYLTHSDPFLQREASLALLGSPAIVRPQDIALIRKTGTQNEEILSAIRNIESGWTRHQVPERSGHAP